MLWVAVCRCAVFLEWVGQVVGQTVFKPIKGVLRVGHLPLVNVLRYFFQGSS